jgi:hypothetical protein
VGRKTCSNVESPVETSVSRSVSAGRALIGCDEAVGGGCDWTSVIRANPCQRQLRERFKDVAGKNYELLVLNINEFRQVTALSLEKWLMKVGVNKWP